MLAPNIFGRSRKQNLTTALVFAVIFSLTVTHWARPSSSRKIQASAFRGHITSVDDANQLCAAHDFKPATLPLPNGDGPTHVTQRRVYDLFLFNMELDWLDIRLNTLYQYVDYFVIVESDRTFTGLPKPLYLQEHWPKFETFHRKIIYVIVEDKVNSTVTWDHEDAFRNALLYDTLEQVAGTEQEPRIGDALIVSDIDEIPRPGTIRLLRYCDFPDRLTLRSHFYYYSFQWLHRGEQWAHPQATIYRGLNATIAPTDLRNGEGGPLQSPFSSLQRVRQKADLFDAAWHCSSCFRTIKETQTKMASFSHTKWNTDENREPKGMIERVRNGIDLFSRKGEVYDKIEGNPDVPKFILDNWQNYRYMLNRDGEDAAFEDAKDFIGGFDLPKKGDFMH